MKQKHLLIMLIILVKIILIINGCDNNKVYYDMSIRVRDYISDESIEKVSLKINVSRNKYILVDTDEAGYININNVWGKIKIEAIDNQDYEYFPEKIYASEINNYIEIYRKEKTNYDEMVLIEGGIFYIGSNDGFANELPITEVIVYSFYIRKYPITQKEYEEIIGINPSWHTQKNNKDILWEKQRPVENVSWWDAIKFANKLSEIHNLPLAYNEETGDLLDYKGNVTNDLREVLGYRLPTEVEWEYAARGRQKTQYAGNNILNEVGWYIENSNESRTKRYDNKGTMPVGMKKSNQYGLYDMSGNVWEWTQDWYDKNAYRDYSENLFFNPIKGVNKVCRGGSWYNFAYRCRVSFRGRYNPDYKSDTIGFRLVRTK